MAKTRSPLLQAIKFDNSLPIEKAAVELWLKDVENPLRWSVRPFLQLILAVFLHLIWFFKRLPLPQFSAHVTLQRLICWFCKYFVSLEANQLILRHFATESNILNFLADNNQAENPSRVSLYPRCIDDMLQHSFVKHDQELFRMVRDLGYWNPQQDSLAVNEICWSHWRPIDMSQYRLQARPTQVLDFESAHALFMCLFCLFLKRDEYRDAINGFNLDQSIAIRIGQLIGDSRLAEMAYNKYPLYLVGPWNLGQRFLMHGFFTEYLYARLESIRCDEQ